MWQENLVSVTNFIKECLDKVYTPANGPFMMARHLISPMWRKKWNLMMMMMGVASLCNDSKTALLLLLGEHS